MQKDEGATEMSDLWNRGPHDAGPKGQISGCNVCLGLSPMLRRRKLSPDGRIIRRVAEVCTILAFIGTIVVPSYQFFANHRNVVADRPNTAALQSWRFAPKHDPDNELRTQTVLVIATDASGQQATAPVSLTIPDKPRSGRF
jgi:hypothetical protein